MDKIVINAFAKINLFLEVCEKRPDNYHNIDSVMHTVSLADIVTVEKHCEIILSNTKGLPNDKTNLAYKAAKAFFDYTGIIGGAKIHIEKNIPISAGLAGGSTDAAAVLKALNIIYDTKIKEDNLCKIGAKLGADVPFCIKGGCYITKGIGDEFTKCNSLPSCFIVISKCGEGMSTPFAYGEIDKLREQTNNTIKTSSNTIEALASGNISTISENLYNIFEKVVIPYRPKVTEQKEIMTDSGAVCTMMSGSGPSVFGLFETREKAENAKQKLKEYGAEAFLCTPVI